MTVLTVAIVLSPDGPDPSSFRSEVPRYGWLAALLLVVLIGACYTLASVRTRAIRAAQRRRDEARRRQRQAVADDDQLHERRVERYRAEILSTYSSRHTPFGPQSVDPAHGYVVPKGLPPGDDELVAQVVEALRLRRGAVVLGSSEWGKSLFLQHLLWGWANGTVPLDGLPVRVDPNRRELGRFWLIDCITEELAGEGSREVPEVIERYLRLDGVTVLCAGLDEDWEAHREEVLRDLQSFARDYPRCSVVITCPPVTTDSLYPSLWPVVSIAGLDDAQILDFVVGWPGIGQPGWRDELTAALVTSERLRRAASDPLLLAMITWLFAKGATQVPTSRAGLFHEFVRVLLDGTEAARYTADDKRAVLQLFALDRMDEPKSWTTRATIPYPRAIGLIHRYINRIAGAARSIVREIVEQTGLMQPRVRGEQLQFADTAFVDYFAAAGLLDRTHLLAKACARDLEVVHEPLVYWCGLVGRGSWPLIREVLSADPQLAAVCVLEASHLHHDVRHNAAAYFQTVLEGGGGDRRGAAAVLCALASEPGLDGEEILVWLSRLVANREQAFADLRAWAAEMSQRPLSATEELADDRADMRDGFTSVGHVGLPALIRLATDGSGCAVDALAAIGSHDSTTSLVELLQLGDDHPASRRAAWHLGPVIDEWEAIEKMKFANFYQRLVSKDFDLSLFHGDSPLSALIKEKIDLSSDADIPHPVPQVPSRIAVPVSSSGIREHLVGLTYVELLRDGLRMVLAGSSLDAEHPCPLHQLVVLDAARVPVRYRYLLGTLEAAARADLVERVLGDLRNDEDVLTVASVLGDRLDRRILHDDPWRFPHHAPPPSATVTSREQAADLYWKMAARRLRILAGGSLHEATETPELGSELAALGLLLSHFGWFDEARAAASEAVEILGRVDHSDVWEHGRRLVWALTVGDVVDEPDRQQRRSSQNLGDSLDRYLAHRGPEDQSSFLRLREERAARHARAGELNWALRATERAVHLGRRRARAHVEGDVDLADHLSTLAARLLDVGRGEEATQTARESVLLGRRGIQLFNGYHEQKVLARCLHHLGICLRQIEQPRDALVAARKAVILQRALAESGSATSEPPLGSYLIGLGLSLAGVARSTEASAAYEEAVNILRPLTEVDPASYGPWLASALSYLGQCLSDGDVTPEAFAVTTEAVELFRRSVANGSKMHEADLGESLRIFAHVRAIHQTELTEALVAVEESLAIYSPLADTLPERHNADLAASRRVLVQVLTALGRTAEAATALEQLGGPPIKP